MQSQWMAGAGAESLRVRRLGEAVFCLMASLILLSLTRVVLGGLGSRLDWSGQTISLIYLFPLTGVIVVNTFTMIRVGDRIMLTCYLVLLVSRVVGQAAHLLNVQTLPVQDLKIAASGITSVLMAVIFYRLVQILLITEEKRKLQVLDRLAETTSHRVGTNFLDGLVASIVDVLNVRTAFISEIESDSRRELILSVATITGEDAPEELQPGSELTHEGEGHWQGANGESLCRIDLIDEEGRAVGCLGLMSTSNASISPGQEASLRIFAARATAEILRVQADRRSRELEARMLHVQKLESLGVLAGGIAHDFNNLLQAIGGSASVTSLMLPESSEARQSNDQIQEFVGTGASMCHRLLAYAGRAVRSNTVCDINTVVRDTAAIIQAARPTCSIALQLSSHPLRIWGDEAQLTQVVINLLTNAADATQGESGRIEVRTSSGTPDSGNTTEMQLSENKEYALIEIADNGCGIDEESSIRVFDPYYTTKGTGRGIGLAVVLGIVKDHHGDISFRAREEQGTTFTVAIPITGRAAESTPAPSARPAVRISHRSVLLVDDDEAVCKTTRLLLEFSGFTVTTAASGTEALDCVQQTRPPFDCILMDQTMPGLSGIETCQRLRRAGVTTPVILTSGFAGAETGIQLPEVTFLSKPYVMEDLLTALSDAMEAESRSLAG